MALGYLAVNLIFLPWQAFTSHRKCLGTSSQSRPERWEKGNKGRVSNWLRTNKAIPSSSLEGRFEAPINGKWLLFHLTPQTQILKTRVVIPPFWCIMCITQGHPPHRNHFSIIFTIDLQDGYGRWEMIVLGEIKREFSGMEKLSDLPMITQGVNQGRWPRPLTPLVFSHFTLEPVQLSRICFSQQISVFSSKSCQFFFPRWAMNLPRVSKQTVERALAFEPE